MKKYVVIMNEGEKPEKHIIEADMVTNDREKITFSLGGEIVATFQNEQVQVVRLLTDWEFNKK